MKEFVPGSLRPAPLSFRNCLTFSHIFRKKLKTVGGPRWNSPKWLPLGNLLHATIANIETRMKSDVAVPAKIAPELYSGIPETFAIISREYVADALGTRCGGSWKFVARTLESFARTWKALRWLQETLCEGSEKHVAGIPRNPILNVIN